MQALNWLDTDEIDLELIRFIEKGYLFQEAIDRAIDSKESRITDQAGEQAIHDAWRRAVSISFSSTSNSGSPYLTRSALV